MPVSPKIRPRTLDAAYATPEELLASLKTSDGGLSDREASDRLAEHGLNEVAYHRAASVPNPTDLPYLCFMGTNVVSGTAIAVAVATGEETLFASLARRAASQRSSTSFDRGINSVSWLFIRFVLLLVPVVLLLNGFTKGDWAPAFLFALSVAVGLTPEMLPVVIAANLTRGAISMVRNKVIVKRLNSIEDLGAMNILCIDKTGTLTIDRIILERHLDIFGNVDDGVLRYAYLNSYLQSGLKNLLDAAILEHGELHQALRIGESYRKVHELPFDFGRRRMSVIVEVGRQQHELICKGAVEEVLQVCSYAKVQGGIVPLSRELRNSIEQLHDEMNEEGLRVLAVAYKDIGVREANYRYRAKDEADLVLAGFIAFLDPPKESIAEALAAMRAEGVDVKILTGDGELVARRICKWVNLEAENALLGSEVESMSDAQLQNAALRIARFSTSPPSVSYGLSSERIPPSTSLSSNRAGLSKGYFHRL
jgi:P-type Mg2+ transporter